MRIAIHCTRCQRIIGRKPSDATSGGTMVHITGVIERWVLYAPCKGCKVSGRR